MEVKRGHAWDNPDTWGMLFLMYDLPKRCFFRSCKILLCIYGLGHSIV